ncbi:serine/threonine-protein kinase [Yinghuangia sp. ASG 101]|uniref:serine/threonine-protein kinase n=1 Tax=Yinghuangia sp. ASG 101 TaxID=2896848 RepID=UPI002F90EE0B
MTMVRLRRQDPRVVGSYRLLRRLGAGGMGVVYLGTDRHGNKVALKLIRPELANNPEFRSRFAREVAAAARVRGNRTAPLVDADPEAARPWLATAYVPGPSLQRRVGDRGPLSCVDLARVGSAVADGLVSVHAAGVVHRDVKPSNILLSPDGPQIIDFGIAYADGAGTLTHTGTAVGSPGFLAPEQVRGQPVTPATDVFALGVTLGYAGRGSSPFGSGPVDVLLYRVVHEEPDLEGVPGPALPLISACLAKDPLMRPSAEEVRDRLAVLARRQAEAAGDPGPRSGAVRTSGGKSGGAGAGSGGEQAGAHRSGAHGNGHDSSARSAAKPPNVAGLAAAAELLSAPPGASDAAAGTDTGRNRAGARPPAKPRTPSGGNGPRSRGGSTTGGGNRPSAQQRRRVLLHQAIVFVIVTAVVALAIAAFQGGGSSHKAADPTPGVVDDGPGELAAAASAPAADWANRTYADPTAGGASVTLIGGTATVGADRVDLAATLPATFYGEPATVVILTRTPLDGGPATHFVELFRFDAERPTALGVKAVPADPRAAATRWAVEPGAILRTVTVPGEPDVVTRYEVRTDGSLR